MRSKVGRRLLEATPLEDRIFVRKYAEIVSRVHAILEQKGLSQRELAERMGKSPSELSRWLNGEHNLTLRSLSKLEAELGEVIVSIPIGIVGSRELPKQSLLQNDTQAVSDTNWTPLAVSFLTHSRKASSTVA